MKKVLQTLKSNWPEYIIEIIVIIIGIIGAFMLNSWHEGRKERQFEKEVLLEIHSDIKSNIKYLDQAIERSEIAWKSGELILDYFDKNLVYNDSLDKHFSFALFWFHPSINNPAYDGVKSYGLHLIRNKQIRESLGAIYEWKFIDRLSIRQEEYFYGTVSPKLPSWFESYEFIGTMKPLDFEKLKMSQEYHHILKTLISNRKMQIGYFESIRQQREDLAKLIETELHIN